MNGFISKAQTNGAITAPRTTIHGVLTSAHYCIYIYINPNIPVIQVVIVDIPYTMEL